MARHTELGKEGEKLAIKFYEERGYEILERNWRHHPWEVDVIASKADILYFIEVKLRSNAEFGFPEENVSKQKIKNLISASGEYLHLHPQWQKIQIDVLAINVHHDDNTEYFLIEDVYVW